MSVLRRLLFRGFSGGGVESFTSVIPAGYHGVHANRRCVLLTATPGPRRSATQASDTTTEPASMPALVRCSRIILAAVALLATVPAVLPLFAEDAKKEADKPAAPVSYYRQVRPDPAAELRRLSSAREGRRQACCHVL